MYRVIVSGQAAREMDEAASWWAENRDAQQAVRWYRTCSRKIQDLARDPLSFSIADESEHFPCEIRELRFGLTGRPTHRVLFTLLPDGRVWVLTIRHVSQDRITPENVGLPSLE